MVFKIKYLERGIGGDGAGGLAMALAGGDPDRAENREGERAVEERVRVRSD
jgi:hypothetical protein